MSLDPFYRQLRIGDYCRGALEAFQERASDFNILKIAIDSTFTDPRTALYRAKLHARG